MALFFVSYRMKGEDEELAETFCKRLREDGHDVFMASDSIRIGANWRDEIEGAITACDYFLVLLSEQAALSEMVITEVRRIRERRAKTGTPVILPVRVNFPLTRGLPYDLDGYLNAIQQREWTGAADTAGILDEIVSLPQRAAAGFVGGPKGAAAQRPNDDERPLPIADPEPLGAVLGSASRFYLARANLDATVLQLIRNEERQLIKLHGPEQIGKSSLLARVIAGAKADGSSAASVSFQLAAADGHLETPERGIKWFCKLLSKRLGFPKTFFQDNWDDELGVTNGASVFLTEALLPRIEKKLVLCIDNLDFAFPYEAFSKSFLPLLRELYDQGADNPELKKLRQIVAYSTDCWVKLPVHQSPFQGVGTTCILPAFGSKEVAKLCELHKASLDAQRRKRLLSWLAGQPYLTRLTFHYAVTRSVADGVAPDVALDSVLVDSASDEGIFGDHLRRKLMSLQTSGNASLVETMRGLARGNGAHGVTEHVALRLLGLGLVERKGNDLVLTSDLYREYFKRKL